VVVIAMETLTIPSTPEKVISGTSSMGDLMTGFTASDAVSEI
jgi:hypothetical protein